MCARMHLFLVNVTCGVALPVRQTLEVVACRLGAVEVFTRVPVSTSCLQTLEKHL